MGFTVASAFFPERTFPLQTPQRRPWLRLLTEAFHS
jgi:hypothetical protein